MFIYRVQALKITLKVALNNTSNECKKTHGWFSESFILTTYGRDMSGWPNYKGGDMSRWKNDHLSVHLYIQIATLTYFKYAIRIDCLPWNGEKYCFKLRCISVRLSVCPSVRLSRFRVQFIYFEPLVGFTNSTHKCQVDDSMCRTYVWPKSVQGQG